MPGPEGSVASLISKLMAATPIPDSRGVYDRVSNLCHPTAYTHSERWELVELEGKSAIVSTVSASDHDRPASLAVATFGEALKLFVAYNGWDTAELDALLDRLPSAS